jgi:hypothetical protein
MPRTLRTFSGGFGVGAIVRVCKIELPPTVVGGCAIRGVVSSIETVSGDAVRCSSPCVGAIVAAGVFGGCDDCVEISIGVSGSTSGVLKCTLFFCGAGEVARAGVVWALVAGFIGSGGLGEAAAVLY